MDKKALYKIGYGLYVLTTKDDKKDNGCIVNTVLQVTSMPLIVTVSVNKENLTHDMIIDTREFNASVLTTETPFKVFDHFGLQSGKTVNKFADCDKEERSRNGIIILPKFINAYLSFGVKDAIDLGTHTMFISEITDGEVINDLESVTYAYYQQHIKPTPEAGQKKGYCCNICNYVYEGDSLPDDFICPICKHGAIDFIKL